MPQSYLATAVPPPPNGERLAELLSAISFATGLAVGAPMEHGLRCAYLGLRIADKLGLSAAEREAIYYGALLKDIGSTACAAGVSAFFPDDELAPRLDMLPIDPLRVGDIVGWLTRNVPVDAQLPIRLAKLFSFVAQCGPIVTEAMRAHCEVAELFARRLGLPEPVQRAVRFQFERWDGRGFAAYHLKGDAIPVSAHVLHLAQILELTHAVGGTGAARAQATERSGKRFEPEVTAAFLALAGEADFWAPLEDETATGTILAMAPDTSADGHLSDQTDAVCEALADFTDIKTRQNWHHSTAVASAAVEIAGCLGLDNAATTQLRRAALLHDLGKVAVPLGILEKGEQITEREREQLRLHPYYTQRVLERVAPLRDLAPGAAAHHERIDGTGFYRQLAGDQIPLVGRILAVANAYTRLIEQRNGGKHHAPDEALQQLRRGAGTAFDARCVDALAASTGHEPASPKSGRRRAGSDELSAREIEVLQHLARGMSNPQIAEALYISRKTVEHHLEHIYGKLGITCRTSAVAYAVQQGLA